MSLTTALTQMPTSPEAAPRQPTRIGSTGQHEALIFASVFAASVAVLLVFDWYLRFDLGDDAYIHLRIAQNLIRTGHPYFNPGDPVMVTSSPIWTIVLACNGLLFGTRNTLWMWNALCVAVASTTSYALAWFHVRPLGGVHKTTALLPRATVIAALSNASPGLAESGQSFRSLGE